MLINDDDAAPTIDIADNSTTNEANGTTNLVATFLQLQKSSPLLNMIPQMDSRSWLRLYSR